MNNVTDTLSMFQHLVSNPIQSNKEKYNPNKLLIRIEQLVRKVSIIVKVN